MELKYPHLFSPIRIRGVTFKNRILAGPLGVNVDNPSDGSMHRENIDYYATMASGGTARVIGGGDCVINADSGPTTRINLSHEPMSPDVRFSMQTSVRAMHRYDCLAFVQLVHAGAMMGPSPFGGTPTKVKGAGNFRFEDGSEIVQMDRDDMERICADYAKSITRARELGLDGAAKRP